MKKNLLKQIALGLATIGILSACSNSHLYKGDRYYNHLAYAKAIDHYEKVYFKSPNKKLGIKLADSYYRTGKLDCAEAVYANVVDLDYSASFETFNYAKVLMANNKHEKAKLLLQHYLLKYKNDPVALLLLTSCNSINDRYRDTSLYAIHPIETDGLLNTFSVIEYQEGIVFIGDKEVFSGRNKSPWTGDSYLDMYQMQKSTDGTWLKPELLLGDINGRFHEGPASFSADGKTVYFTRSNYFKRKLEENTEHTNNLKIFKATLIDGVWKKLEELPFNDDNYSVGHPTLSEDGKTLFFISDMPGGFGGTDLYKTTRVEGSWSTPKNLGHKVNTAGNEMFPYFDEDSTLYFSSDAHNSMGGLDVFITYHTGEIWATPENLNYPINSIKDDFGFSIDKEKNTGFISSSRTDKDQIYTFDRFAPTFNLIGFAHERGSKKPIEDVTVEITDKNSNEILTISSDKNGDFKIQLKHEKEYYLSCTKFGCFSRTAYISTKGLKYSQDFYADFEVERIVIDKPVVLENIYYDFDMWNIRPDAANELDRLAKLLKDNPEIDIEMGSHTDARGNNKYNQILSDRRAYATVQYLIQSGIAPRRLTWKGYGESTPVNTCIDKVLCSELKHQENRRTEFKVTRINE